MMLAEVGWGINGNETDALAKGRRQCRIVECATAHSLSIKINIFIKHHAQFVAQRLAQLLEKAFRQLTLLMMPIAYKTGMLKRHRSPQLFFAPPQRYHKALRSGVAPDGN